MSMMRRRRDTERGEPAELAALADGSLSPERRAALEASGRRVARAGGPARRAASGRSRSCGAPPRTVEAPRRRCGHEIERSAAPAQRSARRLVLAGAVAAAAVGRRYRASPSSVPAPPPSASTPPSRAHRLASGRHGQRDAHEDDVGLADRARCHGSAPARQRALLRGVAEERRRRARADRDVQRGRRT